MQIQVPPQNPQPNNVPMQPNMQFFGPHNQQPPPAMNMPQVQPQMVTPNQRGEKSIL